MTVTSKSSRLIILLVVGGAVGAAAWFLGYQAPVTSTVPIHVAGPFRVAVSVSPEQPRAGKNRLRVVLQDANRRPVSGATIQAMATMPAMRAPVNFTETPPGTYEGELELSMDGAWPLGLTIEAPSGNARLDFDLTTSRAGLRLSQTTPAASPGSRSPQRAGGGNDHVAGPFRLRVTAAANPSRTGQRTVAIETRDAKGEMISGVRVRAVAQRQGDPGQQPENLPVSLRETAPGKHSGDLDLPSQGPWVLAIDAEKEGVGHGDLVFDLTGGGLQVVSATPEGIAHYTCSMHPSVKSATPGTCPICSMNLVPVTRQELDTGTIRVDARRRQLIGVTTGTVEPRSFARTIRAAGRVTYNETRLTDISLKFDAWIRDLGADSIGATVVRGEPLFRAFSPALISAQEEYLAIRQTRGAGDPMAAAARQRLQLWDIEPEQIRQLEQTKAAQPYFPILSPADGVVVEKHVVEGSAIKAGQRILRIAGLEDVWVEGEIYEYELPFVAVGMAVEVMFPHLGDRHIPARLTYVDPILNPRTRTARVRVALPNQDGELRPDMYAHVHIEVDPGTRLAVPENAVLFAGDARIVFVDLGEGRLQPRRVTVGMHNADYYEILGGLKAGETVVTSGNFLIAAESKLKSGAAQW